MVLTISKPKYEKTYVNLFDPNKSYFSKLVYGLIQEKGDDTVLNSKLLTNFINNTDIKVF